MEGFIIKCKKCGAEIEIEGNADCCEMFENEDIKAYVTCYETIRIICKCGNERR